MDIFDKRDFYNTDLKAGDKVIFKKERYDILSTTIKNLEDKEYEIRKVKHVRIFSELDKIITCLVIDDLLQQLPAHHFIKVDRIKDRKNKLKNLNDR